MIAVQPHSVHLYAGVEPFFAAMRHTVGDLTDNLTDNLVEHLVHPIGTSSGGRESTQAPSSELGSRE